MSARKRGSDARSTNRFTREQRDLVEVFTVVAELNQRCANHGFDENAGSLRSCIDELRSESERVRVWTSEIATTAKPIGLIGSASGIVEKLTGRLLGRDSRADDLERSLPAAVVREGPKWIARKDQFASRRILMDVGKDLSPAPMRVVAEALNPMHVVQDFAIGVLGIRPETVNHTIQRAFRRALPNPYASWKGALWQVCASFNEIFYGTSKPSHASARAVRETWVSYPFLLAQLENVVRGSSAAPDEEHDAAFALFLFLHFCGALRTEFVKSETTDSLEYAAAPRLYLTANRPLQYTYFQTRIFGAISGMPGLNGVFRGGLLPHADRGRTFVITGPAGSGKTSLALHMMADMAYRGRLAIYFSIEESYEVIVARLITFGLLDANRFDVCAGPAQAAKLLEARKKDAKDRVDQGDVEQSRKGLLVLGGSETDTTIAELVRSVCDLADPYRETWGRALAVDSIDAYVARISPEGESNLERRKRLVSDISAIESNRFWAIILSEADSQESGLLRYLADTVIELGIDDVPGGRLLQVHKCRTQAYHQGEHPFRIAEGKGVVIYPSVAAVLSTTRTRARWALNESRRIPVADPKTLTTGAVTPNAGVVMERSSVLLWGPEIRREQRLLGFVTEPSVSSLPTGPGTSEPPGSVLIVNFRTPEVRFEQMLRAKEMTSLAGRWERIRRRRVRWYSPGENLTAAQFLAELWEQIAESQRDGCKLERIAFNEVEQALDVLPSLGREPLFWSAVLEQTNAQAITSFFSVEQETEDPLVQLLRAAVDYSFYFAKDTHVEKSPSGYPPGSA